MPKIVLYWCPMSSASPVAAALAELGVEHERRRIDLKAGDQRRPEFLALNPNGAVPTLTVDGAPMFEALAIQLWLGETFGVARGLWPEAGTPARLQAMSWCAWAYVTYGARIVHPQTVNPPGAAPGQGSTAEAAHAALDRLLGLLESRLSRQPWMLGNDYSLVDLVVGSVVGYSQMLGAPVDRHPAVLKWLSEGRARPSMQGGI